MVFLLKKRVVPMSNIFLNVDNNDTVIALTVKVL